MSVRRNGPPRASRVRGGAKARRRLPRVLALLLATFALFVTLPFVFPADTAGAAGPCDLSPALAPEIAGGGVDGLVQPPPPDGGAPIAAPGDALPTAAPKEPVTNYDRYGMAGQFWHTYGLGCSDVTAVLGNAWANTVFSWAKAVDRLTISTYQAAATEGPIQPIKDVADDIITNLANAMYWPYLRPIVILGAIWLAWYGLIRKRATTTTEGVIWMVLAVTVAIWFFSRPGDFTGIGKTVTDKTGEVVNSAFSGLPGAGGASCMPTKDQPSTAVKAGGYGEPGTPGVAQNADALWSTLVCKPWLMGEFGTADTNAPIVRALAAKTLDIQAIDATEQAAKQMPSGDSHQRRFEEELAKPLENTPVFFLFQGKDWTSRLGIAIGAFIAAMVAGVLIFLVAVSLLVLKVGFLLLLIMGPIFLLIGVHPGSGRIIAMRWVEMLVGTLLRQAVLALVLGVLVYGYALIISTTLPWGMQILFMALLTIAVFFYRRPFQHLFASMDGHTLATRMLGEAASAPTLSRAANALPPVGVARAGRWGLRKAEPVIGAAAMVAGGGAAAAAASSVAQGRVRGEEGAPAAVGQAGARAGAQPVPLETDAQAAGRRKAGAAAPRPGQAPPLNLSGARAAATVRPSGGPRPASPGGGSPPRRVPSASGPGPASGVSAGSGASSGSLPASASGAASGRTSGFASGAVRASGSSGGSPSGSPSGSSSGASGGGWFSGRSGGWASRPSGAGGSASRGRSPGLFGGGSRSSGGGSRSSGGGLFGGGSRSSGGSGGSGGGSGSGGSSGGGGLFGGSSRRSESSGGGRSRPAPPSGGSSSRPRSSEAPPLWLPSRGDGGRRSNDAPTPFWAKPSDRDSGE
ncbi:type IV secretion system protein [Microbispora sp. NPDC049125]|uniref:type IV secretion system protein n=1 Tax=Microbispora sp. NPDC049125 TaxID=3154929 RepID=UPI003466B3F9